MYSEDEMFSQLIAKIKEPVEKLADMLKPNTIRLNQLGWDIENREGIIKRQNEEIDMQKRIIEQAKKDCEALKVRANDEKNLVVAGGIKYVSECHALLEKVKEFCTSVEKRQYNDLHRRSQELKEKVAA